MALSTNFNVSPYYDDASENSDFYRILFRPGFGVQARELTQLQTLLQYQIERLGLHSFKNGSKLYGGDITFDNKVKSLKLESAFSGTTVDVNSFSDKIIKGGTSGAQGQVVAVNAATATDQPTLMFELLSANNFSDGETIQTVEAVSISANTVSTTGISGLSGAQGTGSIASISNGSFFVDGFFVSSSSETITVEKYSNTPTKKIGLSITESLIDSTSDSSLLDNAAGTTNYAAPGANRLKISLALATKNLTATDSIQKASDEDFIELIRVENGEKTKEFKYPLYGEIEKTLARRTFDESGDYTVRPFGIQVVANKGGDANKVSVGIEAGKAYIKGYEYETISTKFLDVDKGRDTATVNAFSIASPVGNRIIFKNVTGTFEIHKHELVDLHCVNHSDISALTNDANALTKYNSTKIGTARVRTFDFEQTDSNTANTSHFHSLYAASLYDVRTDTVISGLVDSADGVNNLIINLPQETTSSVNGAYIGATLTVNTTSGSTSTSDVVSISDYVIQGGAHIATANVALSQNVLSNSTFSLSFTASDIDSMAIADKDVSSGTTANSTHVVLTSKADVDKLSKFNFDVDDITLFTDTDSNSLLFPFPYTPIKEFPNNITYQYKRFDSPTSDSTGTLSFTTNDGKFLPGSKVLSSSEAAENFTVIVKSSTTTDATTGEAISNGQILSFATGTNRNIEVRGSDLTVDIKCNTAASFTADVISTIRIENKGPRAKSIVTGNVTSIDTNTNLDRGQIFFSSPNKQAGQKDNLMVADVFNIVRIVDSQNQSTHPVLSDVQNDAKDITSNYILDTGQRDNMYDHASLILKPGAPAPSGRILAIVDYFKEATATEGYFSVDSYNSIISSSANGFNRSVSSGATQNVFSYDSIPTYTSPVTGKQVKLSDVLDFRPVRANANNNSGANTTNDINTNTSSLDIDFGPAGGTPDNEGTITADINYYLGRTDKVLLTRDREFKIKKGVPSLNPVTPADDEDSMTLYTLQIPAYTFNISDISSKYIDNRRFTMRDIGKLERRIENLEYYTSLSLLEKETAARDIVGDSQIDSLFNPQGSRFKNGILVDSFIGHSIGDVSDSEYQVSIDFDEQELRPPFISDNYRFNFNSSNSENITLTGNVATLSYTSNVAIDQPLSSNTFVTVNPYNFVNYIGNLTLDPSSDTWFDTINRPDVLVNIEGINDSWESAASRSGHGMQWSDWSKIWSGIQINSDPFKSVRDLGISNEGKKQAKLTSQVFTRTGIVTTNMPDSVKRIIGNKVIDVSVVPFVRNQTVHFVGRGLKPRTDLYVYFDGIAANTTPAPVLTLTGITTTTHFQPGEIVTQGVNTAIVLLTSNTDSSGTAEMKIKTISTSGAETSAFTTGTMTGGTSGATATISSRTTPTNTNLANTNNSGEVAGSFEIPAGTFRTGERLVRLLDTSTHDISTATTFAETRYAVQGVLASRESSIVSTRLPISRRDDINSEDVYFDQSRRDTKSSNYINPLSQTFFVDKTQNPNGIFCNSIDLFFRQKATANSTTIQLPITVQIRPIRNNLPSPNLIIPFGEKTLRPEEVNAQSANVPSISNTSHVTTVTWDSPVYLPPDEYALTFLTNSKEYQLWTGVEGENATGTVRRITRQPNVGVIYHSQNQTTPTEDPETSITFRLNRCDFTTSATGSLVLSSNATSLSSNTANVVADVIKVNSSHIEFSNTTQTFSYRSTNTSGSTVSSSNYASIDLDKDIYLDERIMLEASTASDFYLKGTLNTSDSKVSPYVDIDRVNLITIENSVDNAGLANSDFYIVDGGTSYGSGTTTAVVEGGGSSNTATITLTVDSGTITDVTVTASGSGYTSTPTVTVTDSSGNGSGANIVVVGETNNRGGNIKAKYLTRKVTLEDGFDASDIKVILNAYKPKTSDIIAYAKVINADDTDTLDDKNFFLLSQETSSSVFSLNEDDIKEFIFKTNNDAVTYTSGNVTYNKFKSFIIKIALLSTESCNPPKIKDLRAIALDE